MTLSVNDLIDALLKRIPVAVVPLVELAGDLDADQITIRKLAKKAEASDLAVYWHEVGGVVLSLAVAESEGLALKCPTDDEINPDGWRWHSIDDVPPERFTHSRGFGGDYSLAEQMTVTHHFPDNDNPQVVEWLRTHSENPQASQARSKRWGSHVEAWDLRMARLEAKTRTIGLSRQWTPDLEVTNAEHCDVCRHRELGLMEVCLGCLRSGLDDFIRAEPKTRTAKAKPTSYQPNPLGLAGGTGKPLAAAG